MPNIMLLEKLKVLEKKRKKSELTAKEFYEGLLDLLGELKQHLAKENIDENQIRRQIPLILTFLKAQIKNLADRGG